MGGMYEIGFGGAGNNWCRGPVTRVTHHAFTPRRTAGINGRGGGGAGGGLPPRLEWSERRRVMASGRRNLLLFITLRSSDFIKFSLWPRDCRQLRPEHSVHFECVAIWSKSLFGVASSCLRFPENTPHFEMSGVCGMRGRTASHLDSSRF